MRPVTAILIAVSLAAAGGAGLLAKNVIENRARQAAALQAERQRDVEVLVAARDLPQGRTLLADDLRWDRWPITTAESAKVLVRMGGQDTLQHLKGTTLRRAVVGGEPVTDAAMFTPGRSGALMPGLIEPGKRAVGIIVTAAATASGFVLPGDRVDVILTVDLKKGVGDQVKGNLLARFASETILADVRVLAVDQELGGASGASKKATTSKKKKSKEKVEGEEPALDEIAIVGKTVAVEVTAEQAEQLAAAQAVGKLSLALRGMAGSDEAPPRTAREFVTETDFSKALKAAAGGGVKIIKAGDK